MERVNIQYKLKDLITHLSSQDVTATPQEDLSFLSFEEDRMQEKVLLTSYPRSGNTLIRGYLEKITAHYTGSDCTVRRKLNKDLLDLGLLGEGKLDNSVWVVKSHYPERIGHQVFKANKCVVIVRSPIDCLTSLFNMIITGSHNKSIQDSDYDKVQGIWEEFVEQEIKVWSDFLDYWAKAPQQIPTYFIRYEDVLNNPQNSLEGLFKFLLNKDSLEGTAVQAIIKKIVQEGQRPEVYKPRSGKVNASKKFFSKEQLKMIQQKAYKQLWRFGYLKSKILAVDEETTGFISEDEEQEQEQQLLQQKDPLAWLKDFNHKMMKAQLKQDFNRIETLLKFSKQINLASEIIREKSDKDPARRGSRQFQETLRKIISEANV